MWVLGISPSHDASAALLRDGVVVAAVAEERLSRIKGDGGQLPRRAIDHVLDTAGIARRDVDCVAVVADRFPADCFRHPHLGKELERRLRGWRHRLAGRPVRDVSLGAVQRALARAGRDTSVDPYLRRARFLAREGFRPDAALRSCDHHLAHAMAAVWGSGFEQAAVVTADGVGHLGTHHITSLWRDGRLVRVAVSDDPGASAGWFYEAITAMLGFRPLRGSRRVALNGGIFANVRLNQHIGQRLGLDRLFIFPGMSDTGNSVGAALLALADLAAGARSRSRAP